MLHIAAAPELYDHVLWAGASEARREELARHVSAKLGPEFDYLGLRRYAGSNVPVAVFVHAAGGLFSLIPGGGFDMGLSPEEEATIRAAREREVEGDEFSQEFDLLLSEIGQMRPLHRVVVPPFLIAQRVLSVGQVRRWLPGFHDPLYGDVARAAAHLDAEQVATILAATGLRLPAEAELEYAARGGLIRRLFPWGDRLPDDATLEAMLADDDGSTHNGFGIHGHGLYPELCGDCWHESYEGAPTDGSAWAGPGLQVVRGGAANCYPWQGCGEWNLLLCALRMNAHAAEFGVALRLVRGLDEEDDSEMAEGTGDGTRAAAGRRAGTKAGVKRTGAEKTASAKAAAKKTGAKKTSAKSAGAKKTASAKAGARKAGAKTRVKRGAKTRAK
ncbi:MAG TPA: SUMF1/EgtB/PvdO family nonheme iron enzyme [Nannocystis sp.]